MRCSYNWNLLNKKRNIKSYERTNAWKIFYKTILKKKTHGKIPLPFESVKFSALSRAHAFSSRCDQSRPSVVDSAGALIRHFPQKYPVLSTEIAAEATTRRADEGGREGRHVSFGDSSGRCLRACVVPRDGARARVWQCAGATGTR